MVDVSSGLEILAEIKLKSENKGLLQASRLSPHLCRRDFPLGLPQAWPPSLGSSMAQLSTLGWCAISAGEPASEAKARWPVSHQPAWRQTTASSRVCNLRPAWDPLVSCHWRAWLSSGLPEHTPSSGNGPRNRNSLFAWVSTWHLTWRGARAARGAALPWFKDNPGSVLTVSLQQRGLRCLEALPAPFGNY